MDSSKINIMPFFKGKREGADKQGKHDSPGERREAKKEKDLKLWQYVRRADAVFKKYKDGDGQPDDISSVPDNIEDEAEAKMYREMKLNSSFRSKFEMVDYFRHLMKEVSSLGLLLCESAKEQSRGGREAATSELLARYADARAELKSLVNGLGPVLEYNYRDVLKRENKSVEFKDLVREEQRLEAALEAPTGVKARAHDVFDRHKRSLDSGSSSAQEAKALKFARARDIIADEKVDLRERLEDPDFAAEWRELAGDDAGTLEKEYPAGGEEHDDVAGLGKPEIEERLREVRSKIEELWDDEIVQVMHYRDYVSRLVKQDQMGVVALEIPTLVDTMNRIATWERRHPESIVSAVLVGPPGTSKSMGLERYLETHPDHKDKGAPVIIDMSQETTEWMLMGGEAVDVNDSGSTVQAIDDIFRRRRDIDNSLRDAPPKERAMLQQEKKRLDTQAEDIVTAHLGRNLQFRKEAEKDEAGLLGQGSDALLQALQKGETGDLADVSPEDRERLMGWAEKRISQAISSWQAHELGKVMYGNGWRDGVLLKAIIEGRDVIINEFNNFSIAPDSIRQLLQTPYNGEWFYAGTGKKYPVRSRMYLTANAGSSAERFFNDTNEVAAALQSRMPPPIEAELPDNEDELLILQAKLSDNNLRLKTARDRSVALHKVGGHEDLDFDLQYNERDVILYLFNKVVPRLRALAVKYPRVMPSLDLRHVDRFCRELVNQHTRERNNATVDEAFVKAFIMPYKTSAAAWNKLLESRILVDDLYKQGLLHDEPGTAAHDLMVDAIADMEGIDIQNVDVEARKSVLTGIEKKMQEFDGELIRELQEIEGDDRWKEMIKQGKKQGRVDVSLPFVADEDKRPKMPETFTDRKKARARSF